MDVNEIWKEIRDETKKRAEAEPVLASFFHATVLEHDSFSSTLANQLANDLSNASVQPMMLRRVIKETIDSTENMISDIADDLLATKERDPACKYFSTPLLFYKGFRALQSHKVSHWLWNNERHTLALFIQSRASEVYGIDIHPAAKIGKGVMIDHGTGVVIGETSVVEDNVSIFQGVTLGGTGKQSGDRHPKVREGVLLSAGAKVLGNVEVGKNAKVAAGSVVLSDVKEGTTVAGIPAIEVGKSGQKSPAYEVDHKIET
ncbi:MAG: serine O-acetyltransferase [SAR86 cluster bacterium]|jgi:serine O-acetyltransferase|nr:serine O-acetyltransferase [SAR86 cluster bacterium]